MLRVLLLRERRPVLLPLPLPLRRPLVPRLPGFSRRDFGVGLVETVSTTIAGAVVGAGLAPFLASIVGETGRWALAVRRCFGFDVGGALPPEAGSDGWLGLLVGVDPFEKVGEGRWGLLQTCGKGALEARDKKGRGYAIVDLPKSATRCGMVRHTRCSDCTQTPEEGQVCQADGDIIIS